MADGSGLRFNKGKTRYDLIPSFAQEQYAKVLTIGADKYGEDNWKKGMKWTTVLASLQRHLEAIKKGEDYDKESGLLHSAHIMCNAGFLTEYYHIYPQGDDRDLAYLNTPRICINIDNILNDLSDIDIHNEAQKLDRNFWLEIPVRVQPSDISYIPYCYVSSLDIPIKWIEMWLLKNGYYTAPVYVIDSITTKVNISLQHNIDIFVDDNMRDFIELNKNGICCYLLDTDQNKHYDIGHKRIKSMSDLPF